jgi:hypothetical protein
MTPQKPLPESPRPYWRRASNTPARATITFEPSANMVQSFPGAHLAMVECWYDECLLFSWPTRMVFVHCYNAMMLLEAILADKVSILAGQKPGGQIPPRTRKEWLNLIIAPQPARTALPPPWQQDPVYPAVA